MTKGFWTALFLILSCDIVFAQTPNDGRSYSHVFPQFVDGKFTDLTYYRSTLSLTSVTDTPGSCVAKLNGAAAIGIQSQSGTSFTLGTLTIAMDAGLGGWYTARSIGTGAVQQGYVTLNCTQPTTAQVTYAYYAADGAKLSEATVFSSPTGTTLQLFADDRDGAKLGLAIANNTAIAADVQLTLYSAAGGATSSTSITIPALGVYVKFLEEAIPGIPPDQVGAVDIVSSQPVSAIGLRYTGNVFTTFPSTVLVP